jgi:gamma-glutamyl hercynylcysteine S-oxide synthase
MATTFAAQQAPSLLQRLAAARARTDELFAIVRPEALYDRPIAERHRLIFYTGHLEAFDWNLLGRGHFNLPSLNATFDRLFAFGIDPVGGGLPTDIPEDWPSRAQVHDYNQKLRRSLDEHLAATRESRSNNSAETEQLIEVAIEHRLMHAETLSYLLHQMPLDRKFHHADAPPPSAPPAKPHMIHIPAGTATLGLRAGPNSFGWDNEFDEHQVTVPEFRIDAYKVTNGEFLKFHSSGGYQNRSLWNEADWNWLQSNDTSHPSFWIFCDGKPYLRTMFDEIPLPLDWPVYVSHAEASAYARWSKKELPSEAEWHRAAYGTISDSRKAQNPERAFPWGEQFPAPNQGNFDFHRWDPAPVAAYSAGASAFGVHGLLGNGWEWTRTIFAPFPGFKPFPFYPGYSADFFDGHHFVMKGGSSRTAACMLRRSFRNWFQPHYPYVYTGFRCIER